MERSSEQRGEIDDKRFQLVGVPSSSVEEIWPRVEHLIKKGLEHGRGELDATDVLKFLIERVMQLWVVMDMLEDKPVMAGCTEIVNYPRKKVCRAVVLGGDSIVEWMKHVEGIEEWARTKDCDHMDAFVRKGLAKKMAKIDYKQEYVVLGKDL